MMRRVPGLLSWAQMSALSDYDAAPCRESIDPEYRRRCQDLDPHAVGSFTTTELDVAHRTPHA